MLKYIIIVTILLIYILYENRVFKVARYTVYSDKFKDLNEDIKIVVLADLHNHVYGKENDTLIEAIEKEDPDLILVAGDLIVAKTNQSMEVAIDLMKKLAKKHQIYYGLGNHEYRLKIYPEQYIDMYDNYLKAIQSDNLHVLENKSTKIFVKNTELNIYGLEIEKEYYKRFVKTELPYKYVDSLIGSANELSYNILLAHNPKYFKSYAKWGADLTLAGHIHGGLIRLPFLGGLASPQVEFFPKYDGGLFREGESTMVLSRGLGTHTINVRINNRAELVSIRLRKK
jgi:uncharacterized protein